MAGRRSIRKTWTATRASNSKAFMRQILGAVPAARAPRAMSGQRRTAAIGANGPKEHFHDDQEGPPLPRASGISVPTRCVRGMHGVRLCGKRHADTDFDIATIKKLIG